MGEGRDFHVGFVGAGIGGMAAAIAMRRTGAKVTVLEAAAELGEIGAGIQMTPNVSRLLIKWGVDKAIGANLVQIEELNMRRYDGTKVGHTDMSRIEQAIQQPWWLVHRAHLHQGLVDVAREMGAELITNAKVAKIDHQNSEGRVNVKTETGKTYNFDLCIGSDGLNSVCRRTLFPDVKPEPPTTNCAFRAIVPTERLKADPLTAELVEKKTMEVWMGPKAYIITYPISDAKDFNLVLSHHMPEKVRGVVPDIPVAEMQSFYKDFDPRIRRVLEMIPEVSRWPLMVTGPLKSWSSPQKNLVLMGDAAHSMVNHMAQGAATSMEDGAFLAKCVGAVVDGKMTREQAIGVYEAGRMPKAYQKQQISFLNGAVWHLPDGPEQEARDAAMAAELVDKPFTRSSNLYGDPQTVLDVYGYDAEEHAENEVEKFLAGGEEPRDRETGVTSALSKKYMNWFLTHPPLGKIPGVNMKPGNASKL